MKINPKSLEKKSGKIRAVFTHIRFFLKKCYRDNVAAMAGQSSFFLMLSVVPMLMFAFSLISLLTGKDIEISDFFAYREMSAFPYLVKLMEYVIDSVHKANSGVIVITAVMTLWSAGKGMYCVTDGIMRVYKIPNRTIWLFRRVYAMGYTIVLLFVFFLGVVFVTFNIVIFGTVVKLSGYNEALRVVLQVVMFIIFALFQSLLLTFALKLYLRGKIKNDAYRTFRALFPGMFLAVAAWNGLTIGMIFYVRHFATSSIYGSLASVFMLMIWLYFMMVILLYGIQFDYVYRRRFSTKWFKKREIIKGTADGDPQAQLPNDPAE